MWTLALDQTLEQLAALDWRAALRVERRYSGGCSKAEAPDIFGDVARGTEVRMGLGAVVVAA
jgi:hypothetical protein